MPTREITETYLRFYDDYCGLCGKQRKPKRDILITGVGGRLNDPDRAPFMILHDGSGDNGSECKVDQERYFDRTSAGRR